MPLIVVCGLPNSGKSVRTKEIVEYLRKKKPDLSVKLISEDTLKFERNAAYKDSKQEKDTRGTLKSEVDRWLTKDNLVILDSLNYIKGFRYELYCIARAQSSTHCVVYVDTTIEMCKDWKEQQEEKDTFNDDLMDQIAFRFETPNGKNRWDAPLFCLHPLEQQSRRNEEEKLVNLEDLIISESDEVSEPKEKENEYKYFKDTIVLEDIYQALFHGIVPKPHLATQSQKLENTNFVHELDRITQAIISGILEAQNTAIIGDPIAVPETQSKVILRKKIGMAELRRQRRRYLKLAQLQPPAISKIADTFVTFLNGTFESE